MNDKPITLVDAKTWKGLGDDARATTGMVKAHASRPKAVKESGDETERLLSWIVSTEGRDRDGDRVMQAGWDLDNFRNNPVVMFAHDYGTLPIGRALETEVVEVDGGSVLRMVKQFTPRDLNPMGFMVFQLARDKYLGTASVGFIPRKAVPDPELAEEDRGMFGGFLMEDQELLESSVVPIPSNPGALIEARSMGGIDTTPYIPWAEKILDAARSPASGFSREQVEDIHRATAPEQRFFDMGKSARIPIVKSALTWDDSHPEGTPVADREMEWDGPAQIAAADIEDLIVMATWVDDESPDEKGSYKLPHHVAGGEHATVWRGLTAAMGALLGARGGVDIPDADRQAVYDHLARHYRDDFDEDPPEFRGLHDDDEDREDDDEDELEHLNMDNANQKGAGLSRLLNDLIDGMVNDDRSRADIIESVASAGGIEPGTVNQILRGDIDCPPLDRLEGFAEALGVSMSRIISAAESDGCEYGERSYSGSAKNACECGRLKGPRPVVYALEVRDGAVYLGGRKVQRCQRVTVTPGPDGESVVTLELIPTDIKIDTKSKPVIGKGEPEPTPDNVINFSEMSATDIGALVSDALKPKADA